MCRKLVKTWREVVNSECTMLIHDSVPALFRVRLVGWPGKVEKKKKMRT